MEREEPKVASQLSQCLSAGTGCQWCVPFLCSLHEQYQRGETPDLPLSPEEYARRRAHYKRLKASGLSAEAARGDYRDPTDVAKGDSGTQSLGETP
jgi:hypothetical protein